MMTRWPIAVAALLASATLSARPRQSGPTEVTAIRYWSLAETTRVAIEITGEVHYRSDRVENPDRIFFDFVGARPSINGRRLYSTEVGDKLLKRIRVAETAPGVTRVVFDLESNADFSVSRLDNPDRLIIELRPSGPASVHRTLDAEDRPATPPEPAAPLRREPRPMAEPPKRTASVIAPVIADPPVLKADLSRSQMAHLIAKPATIAAPPAVVEPAPSLNSAPSTEPAADLPGRQTAPRGLPKAARAASDGERSLTRALGLKINRVLIDPGHGGTDQGTVGRRGLMEKDLVLDVAKRLGKLIEERMGSEVIYTRTDDTFIPLHDRTELANQKKADLFLSIHANSSPHPRIGGIEVYYLNFTSAPDALDVAARENASSDKSVFELHDLIQSITLNDKIEESKQFATKVQGALQTFETRYNAAAKNRGVKKAPFVVLIGASMPSVLAEIGFLSNAREEQLLRRPEHRQKLAEALYQGVSRYAQSLSHYQVAQRTE
ncbi:MAG TPA: N-acetylmuramoyl-L-alanine amidase [Bryobacteraceae bacterium]|nr:N-acetylmuramoyl-L-alanine amidase [Bryobacteraceae bacterium]